MGNIHARLHMGDVEVKPEGFERLNFPPADDRSWVAIRRLLGRPWFSRLWTVQEAVLSKRLFVQCGTAAVDWDSLATWTLYLGQSWLLGWLAATNDSDSNSLDLATPHQPTCSGGDIINAIDDERIRNLTFAHLQSLLLMLVATRYANATEPKDKIYGVLGMSESQMLPDYSPTKTARDVYHDASLSLMPAQTCELLSCVDHDMLLEPSWVPDWSTARVTESLGYLTKAWALYSAGRNPGTGESMSFSTLSRFVLSYDKKRLTLSGILFDKVVALGCVSKSPTLDVQDPPRSNRDLASYVDLLKSIRNTLDYPSPSTSVYDAFWQTVVAGRDGSGAAAPTQEHSEVFSLILDFTTGAMPSLPGQIYSPRRQKGFFTLNSLRSRKPAKTFEDLQTAMRAALTMGDLRLLRRAISL
jgi:hypothetical protein